MEITEITKELSSPSTSPLKQRQSESPVDTPQATEEPSSQPTSPLKQRQSESPVKKFTERFEVEKENNVRIRHGEQQLFSRRMQEGEKLILFIGRKSISFLTKGAYSIPNMHHEGEKIARKNIKKAQESKERGAVKQAKIKELLVNTLFSPLIYISAFIFSTLDAIFPFDTDGRRKTSELFPEWEDIKEGKIDLANSLEKLATEIQKFLDDDKTDPQERKKAKKIKKKVDKLRAPTPKITFIIEKLALLVQPAQKKPVDKTTPSTESTNKEIDRTDNTAPQEKIATHVESPGQAAGKPLQSYQEKLKSQKKLDDQKAQSQKDRHQVKRIDINEPKKMR